MSFIKKTMRSCAILISLAMITFTLHAEEQRDYFKKIEIKIQFNDEIQKKLYSMARKERKLARKIKKYKGDGKPVSLVVAHGKMVQKNALALTEIIKVHNWPNNHAVGAMGVHAAFKIFDKAPLAQQKIILPHFNKSLKAELLDSKYFTSSRFLEIFCNSVSSLFMFAIEEKRKILMSKISKTEIPNITFCFVGIF